MSDRRTVPIVCARAPRHIVYVPAVRETFERANWGEVMRFEEVHEWRCSFCGARVRVVA